MEKPKIISFEEWSKLYEKNECNECFGDGYTECFHCGSETECEECGGYGFLINGYSPKQLRFIYKKQVEEDLKKYNELMKESPDKASSPGKPDGEMKQTRN